MTCKIEWAYKGREILAGLAAEGHITTYGSYYDAMAPLCGWEPRTRGNWWANNYAAPTLFEIARLDRMFDEPMLPALVRKADLQIGDGFAGAVMERYDVVPDDLQAFARVEAGRCFVHYGQPR